MIREYAAEGAQWLRGRRQRFRDVLYLARSESDRDRPAVGVGMITIYEEASWAVNPYIAVDRRHRRENVWRAMREVVRRLVEQSPAIEAVVFELEKIRNSDRADFSYLRTRFFQGSEVGAVRVPVPYYQPVLERDRRTLAKARALAVRSNKMHLMLIPIRRAERSLTYDKAVRLADFLYLDFYLDTYHNAKDFQWYKQHLTDLRERVVADLGEWKARDRLDLETVKVPAIRRPHVFLAQSCPDLAWQLDEALYAEGIDVRFWEKIRGLGHTWQDRVRAGLRGTQAVMVLLSRSAFDGSELRDGIREELKWADDHRQLVVPIVSVQARNLMRRHRDGRRDDPAGIYRWSLDLESIGFREPSIDRAAGELARRLWREFERRGRYWTDDDGTVRWKQGARGPNDRTRARISCRPPAGRRASRDA